MSALASLLTGKNRRRVLQALIAAPLLALGIAAGPGTAHASSAYLIFPTEIPLADGYCAVSGWPHGEIYCGTSAGVNFPNNTQEIFGIGLNKAVWTDWGTQAKPSGWKSMGAPPNRCDPTAPLFLGSVDDAYALDLECGDPQGNVWYDDRSAGVNGGWGGWMLNRY
jgi:hypothetical protein